MKRKILALFTALALCLGMCPPVALADVAAGNVAITEINGQIITFTAERCGDSCQGHTITQNVSGGVAQNTTILVESGTHNITFSGLTLTTAKVGVMPSATMNLTIDGTNSIGASSSMAGIYVPVGATLVITEQNTGSLNVSGNASGAGIGGGFYDPKDDTGNLNCGTVIINGGTITATGSDMSAGIGGAAGSSSNPTPGNGGTVVINGGTVTATGGSDGYYGGAGIGGGSYDANKPSGCGGKLTINGGSVTMTAGKFDAQCPAYGFGQGSGRTPSSPCELTLADESYLTLTDGTTLDPNGTYTLNGDPTEDMITVPTGLIYNGQDQTEAVKAAISLVSTGNETKEFLGRTFRLIADTAGWDYTISPEVVREAGDYTVTYTKDGKTVSKTFTVEQSGTEFKGDGVAKAYLDDVEQDTFVPDNFITVIATPTATGQAPANTAMIVASLDEPTGGQMALFVDDAQVSMPESANADGSYTMTVHAGNLLRDGYAQPGQSFTLTAKFMENDNMAAAECPVTITINAIAKVTMPNGNSTTTVYYGTFENAWTDAQNNSPATVTLLANAEASERLTTTSETPIILDAGAYTLALPSSGFSFGGSVRLRGGTFQSSDSITLSGKPVINLLDNSDGIYRAFYQDGKPVRLETNQNALPAGTYTVAACKHDAASVKQYQHNDGTEMHTLTCLACGYTETAANCSYNFSGSVGTCPDCQDTLTVSVTGTDGLIYDGTAQEPTVTVKRGETALAASKYTVEYSDNTNAGTASVTVTIGSNQGTYTETFSIGKATPTITWPETSKTLTYTGQPANITLPTVTLINGETFNGTINYAYGTYSGPVLPTDAGTYTIKASIAEQGNYIAAETANTLTLTINPSTPTLSLARSYDPDKTYDGQPVSNPAAQDLTITDADYSDVVCKWVDKDGKSSMIPPKNASTYTLTISIPATNNTEAAEPIKKEVWIRRAELTISSATIGSKTYDGNTRTNVTAMQFTGLVNGETLILGEDYSAYGVFEDANAGENKAVTVYMEEMITEKAENYGFSNPTFQTTGTITAKSLAGATANISGEFSYTGEALMPEPTVTLDGKTLVKDTDYTVSYAGNVNTGTATVTITGKGNYSGTATGSFSIAKATLTAEGNGVAKGTYGDTLSALAVEGLTVKLNGTEVTGTWKLAGDTIPHVGDSGTYTATFTPNSGVSNYNTLTAQVTLEIAKAEYSGTATATTSAKYGTTASYDLTALLPEGATVESATTSSDIFEGDPAVNSKSLTYKLKTEATVGSTGTITVSVTSTNYNDFSLTITVKVSDKDVPTLTITPINTTYTGKAVPDSAIKGTAKVGETTVPGTWSFAKGQALTNVADSGTKTVKFTPDETNNYAEVEGTVTVTIHKATPTGAPKYTAITTSGKTLADAGLSTEGGSFNIGGTVAWQDSADTEVKANTQYTWIFTPGDTANYNTLTGSIELWHQTSGGSGGGSSGGTSIPPVTTDTTDTTAKPTASNQNGIATTTVSSSMGAEIVKQATANQSENVVIKPQINGSVTKTEVSIPASTLGQIGSQTAASLTVSTPVADVTISNGGLGSLSSTGGTVTVTAELTGNLVDFSVTAGGKEVESIPGGVTLTVPTKMTTPGTVAVLIKEDGIREVVRKSVADGNSVKIPLDGSAKLEIVDNIKSFDDVPSTSWAADAVAFAGAHELFNGTAPGTFSPSQSMSRGMLAVVLHNLESNPDQPLTGLFADVGNDTWYAEGVAWAAENGIVAGVGNGKFAPNNPITREQLATMLWRYAGEPKAKQTSLGFADSGKVSDYAFSALCWATEQGIVNGKGDGILDPLGTATRAEVAQMLMNYLKK